MVMMTATTDADDDDCRRMFNNAHAPVAHGTSDVSFELSSEGLDTLETKGQWEKDTTPKILELEPSPSRP